MVAVRLATLTSDQVYRFWHILLIAFACQQFIKIVNLFLPKLSKKQNLEIDNDFGAIYDVKYHLFFICFFLSLIRIILLLFDYDLVPFV